LLVFPDILIRKGVELPAPAQRAVPILGAEAGLGESRELKQHRVPGTAELLRIMPQEATHNGRMRHIENAQGI